MEKLFIIKISGNVIDEDASLHAFLEDFASIKAKKILVHGGGKVATRIGEQLGLKPAYVNGRRITDADTIGLVTMVYGGLLNKQIVAQLQALHCNAIGLTGADANVLPATKRPVKEIDYGFVGDMDPAQLKTDNWQLFLANGLTPVVAPLTHDGGGQMLNTNADTIASTLAVLLSGLYAVRLVYCFEKAGVLEDVQDEHSVVPLVTPEKYRDLLEAGKIHAGMIPKMENAFSALNAGVSEVLIGRAEDLILNCTDETRGTLIKNG